MTVEAVKQATTPTLPASYEYFMPDKKLLPRYLKRAAFLKPGNGLLLILFLGFSFACDFRFLFDGNDGSDVLQAVLVIDIDQSNALGIPSCLSDPSG